jgi:hypothetical protein
MVAYSEVYVPYIERNQGEVFTIIREQLPGVDEKWFAENYMCSNIRRLLDHANPKYAAMPPGELISRFIEDECNENYPKGEKWGGFIGEWAGRIYALYQWRYNIPSKELVSILSPDSIERVYPALHQMGWDSALEKIHEVVLRGEHRDEYD